MKTNQGNTLTLTRPGSIAALTFAAALFIVPTACRADIIYVSNGGNNTIEEFTAGGVGFVFASTGLNTPDGMAFDSAGNLFVGNYAGNSIEKFTPGGVGSLFTSTGLSAPYALVFDSVGNLFVANAGSGSGYIEKFTPGGIGSVFASTGLNYPIGMAFGAGGNLYVANMFANSIEKFTPGGVGSVFASTGLNNPQQIAFDSAGNVYVSNKADSNPGSGYIEKFTPGGVGSVFASGLYFPYGLAFDSAGNLFATSRGVSNNLIYQFAPNGAESIFATTGVSVPESIVIQATPEPSTWALLCVGVVTFLAFRHRSPRSTEIKHRSLNRRTYCGPKSGI